MSRLILFTLCTISTLLIAAAPYQTTIPTPAQSQIPPGFKLILSAKGADLYRKDYEGGNPDFVQVIHLNRGASLELLYGKITNPGYGRGVYGGPNARILQQKLEDFWKELTISSQDAFCVTNGQFFYMKDYPTRLAFPLKTNGEIISDGYGINEYPEQKLMLEIWEDHADIRELSKAAFYNSPAPDIIGGLEEDANKKSKFYVGRTFVGVDDQDSDGSFETLYIFNTVTARQIDAASVLKDFGADRVMMLDGGGSTQLICQGKSYIKSDRYIPTALGVIADSVPPYQAIISSLPTQSILMEGMNLALTIDVINAGSKPWKAEENQLVLDNQPWGTLEKVNLHTDLQPNEKLTFSWITKPYNASGVYQTTSFMEDLKGKRFQGDPGKSNVIVIPQTLGEKKEELEGIINKNSGDTNTELDSLVNNWIEQESALVMPAIQKDASAPISGVESSPNPLDVGWIPLIIAPIAILLFLAVSRYNRKY